MSKYSRQCEGSVGKVRLVLSRIEGRITRKIVYEIFVISKSQDLFGRFLGFLRDFWGFFDEFLRDF